MDNYTVYILYCKDKSFYVGVTNDIERRLYEHNFSDNESSYTFRRRPAYLVYYTHYPDAKQAIAFEKQLKKWSRKKKIALIKENWESLHELAQNYA